MDETEQLVGILQVSDPGVPAAILDTVAKTGEEHHDGKDGKRGVEGHGDIADYTTKGTQDGNTTLAEIVMDEVAGECGGQVSNERYKEEKRDDGIVDVVVSLNLLI